MADESQNTQVQAPPTVTTAAAPSAPAVPEDYEELKAFRDAYQTTVAPVLERLGQRWDDLRPLIENDEDFEYWKAARDARQRQIEASKPKYSPEIQALRDEFSEFMSPMVDDFKSRREAEQRQQQEQIQAATAANLEYAKRLVAEHPRFAEQNFAIVNALANWAYRDGVSLEESYKRYGSYFVESAPQRREPPQSLRAGAAAPGVPGESKAPPITSRKSLHDRLVANMKAGR